MGEFVSMVRGFATSDPVLPSYIVTDQNALTGGKSPA